MKKKLYSSICVLCLVAITLCACGKQEQELANMTTKVNDDYVSIIWEEKTYVPYCAISKKDCGEQIGIVDDDEDNRVYEYKGYSSDEWIVNSYISGLMDGSMLYKEINVSNIPDGLESEYEWNNGTTVTFQATVIEINNDTIFVQPVDGSSELDSADKFSIPNDENLKLQVGNLLEITYNGNIMESYPAQLGEVYEITVIEQAEANTMWDRIPMVRVNGKLYYDTGKESTVSGRCGNMDGEITSEVDGSEIPTENNQSNFGTGFGYQYGEDDTIEIYMNEKWFVFEYREEKEHQSVEPTEPSVIKTYEVTESDTAFEDDELVTMVKYYEMSDGTWKTDTHTYQYRLEITGRMGGAEKDSTFVFLSNIENITFEQAWKAAGFSSNMDDYFKEDDAKFVALK